jgi:nucleotide-binding universal stress UspA family protein
MPAPGAGLKLRCMKSKRIVIATDGSAGAREAVETGLSLARGMGASVTLVYVRAKPRSIVGDPLYQRSLSSELAQARATLDEATALAEEAGVDFESEILEGNPADRVAEVARNRDADLIVVGSRGRGAFAGAVLGSVSLDLAHRADRPVLVARSRVGAHRRAA